MTAAIIANQLTQVRQQIKDACLSAQRDQDTVNLLAISKRHSIDKIRQAYACQQVDFGENYLNEALEKQQALADLPIVWHYIGGIQSNKTRKLAEHFAWIHTVDSLKIAQRLSNQRPAELGALNICLQVNIDGEISKSGLTADEEILLAIAREIRALPNIKLRGLMCIPAPKDSATEERDTFNRMRSLFDTLNTHGLNLDTLSMGMSNDLPSAIACGATIVRVGTAIFGART